MKRGNEMLPAIMLFEAILKIAPEVVSLIEEVVGDDNTIPADQVPKILSKMVDVTKNSPSLQNHKAVDSDHHNPN